MYTIGIDEVGRGALAGPVVVAVVALPKEWREYKLRDSKRLTPKVRERLFEYARDNSSIFYSTARVYPRKIDEINIAEAANLAATRAFLRLMQINEGIPRRPNVYLDGSLYLQKHRLSSSGHNLKAKTIIKGDEKINAIKLASIVAKVIRDRYMVKLHKSYPKYRFDIHKGYGTKLHRLAIRRYGISDVHRKSFKVKSKN